MVELNIKCYQNSWNNTPYQGIPSLMTILDNSVTYSNVTMHFGTNIPYYNQTLPRYNNNNKCEQASPYFTLTLTLNNKGGL
jgi:hypothetical protein